MDRAYPDCEERLKDKKWFAPGNRGIYIDRHRARLFHHGKDFLEGMENIIKFATENNCVNACSWLVNEASFETTNIYPDLMERLYLLAKKDNCEIGLHTHFESSIFKCEPDGSFIDEKWAHTKI